MKRGVVIVLIALALGAAGWLVAELGWLSSESLSGLFGGLGRSRPGGAATSDVARGSIHALGRIEPAGGVITVTAMPGRRIEALLVKEGEDNVAEGTILAELDSHELYELDLRLVEKQLEEARRRRHAELGVAEAQIATAQLGKQQVEAQRLGIVAQQKKIGFLEESLALAQRDFEALKGISSEVVSRQERDRQQLLVRQAESELEAAQALLKQMQQQADVGDSVAVEKVRLAEAGKDQVEAAVPIESLEIRKQQAEIRLDQSQIKAPCRGTVLKVFARPGELLGAEPILQMADLTEMVVLAEVHEADVGRLSEGQTALIRSRALPACDGGQAVAGRVERIGRMIAQPGIKGLDPFAPADVHVVEVRIKLDPQASRQCRAYVNLQVDVEFPPAETVETQPPS